MPFRLRRIFFNSDLHTQNILSQIRQILHERFPRLTEDEIDQLFELFRNPTKIGFQTMIFIADDSKGRVLGTAIVLLEPNLNFFYLDYIAVAKILAGRGVGGAIYQRVQQEAKAFRTAGIFMDCETDDPSHYPDPKLLKMNRDRLRFYEEHGAFPILNNDYAFPLKPEWHPAYLVYDDLGTEKRYSNVFIQRIVKSILDRRYGAWCPVQFIEKVVNSFQDDPFQLRPPQYIKKKSPPFAFTLKTTTISPGQQIIVVQSDQHQELFIPTRGYYEVPVRIASISAELKKMPLFSFVKPREYDHKIIFSVHDDDYVNYMETISEKIRIKRYVFPVVFPVRNLTRPPTELIDRIGYYCMDNTTPLVYNIFTIAKRAIECTLTAADHILNGHPLAYSLVRPPGHHAESRIFGGYCYFNNNATAADYLSHHGKVAILDLDYHHGNGQEEIFYQRSDVLTISIHGDPDFEFPFFSGFVDDIGKDEGEGYNVNYPLQRNVNGQQYLGVLTQACQNIRDFAPKFLVIPFGLDTAKGDPTGTWLLEPTDYEMVGRRIGQLKIPTLVVQEGGYDIKKLGINAASFFKGLWEGFYL